MKRTRTFIKVSVEIGTYADYEPEDIVESVYKELANKCKNVDDYMGSLAHISIKALPDNGEVIRTAKEK